MIKPDRKPQMLLKVLKAKGKIMYLKVSIPSKIPRKILKLAALQKRNQRRI